MISDRGSIGYNNRESLSPEAAAIALGRSASQQSAARKSVNAPTTALPTPPPSIPLPALPADRATSPIQGSASPPASRHASKDGAGASAGMTQMIEEQEARIRTIEKHLFAEKQLTATLEEALVDQVPADRGVVRVEPPHDRVHRPLVVVDPRLELHAIRSSTMRRFDSFAGISVSRPLRKKARSTASSSSSAAPSSPRAASRASPAGRTHDAP